MFLPPVFIKQKLKDLYLAFEFRDLKSDATAIQFYYIKSIQGWILIINNFYSSVIALTGKLLQTSIHYASINSNA